MSTTRGRGVLTVRLVGGALGVAFLAASCGGAPAHRSTRAGADIPATVVTTPSTTTTTAPTTTTTRPPPPVRILFAGDSMAGSLAVGVAQVAGQYGAEVVNEGQANCAATLDQLLRVRSDLVAPKAPCVPGDPDAILGDMRYWIHEYNPDVVLYFAKSELFDDEVNGSWTAIGQAAGNQFVTTQLAKTVDVLASDGARVVVLTNPNYYSGKQPNGSEWPEDDPQRIADDNSLMSEVVAAHSSAASLLNSAPYLDLGVTTPSGAPVRCPDALHVDPAGGENFAANFLPVLVAVGRAHADANAGRAPLPPQPARPPWWGEILCG